MCSGYLSPEYIVDGAYSTKSDVFSFGVLVLEIVSGKRNRGFYHEEHRFNLLGHVSCEILGVPHCLPQILGVRFIDLLGNST